MSNENPPSAPAQIPNGFKLRHTLSSHPTLICHLAWSPDGRMLASSSFSANVNIWNVENGELYRRLTGYTSRVYDIAWSPDGRILASASADKTITFWDVKPGKIFRQILGPDRSVKSVTWARDGKTIISGCDDNTVQFWNVQTREPGRKIRTGASIINVVAASPDGRAFASPAGYNSIQIWDMAGEKLVTTTGENSTELFSINWSPDGQTLASAGYEKIIRIWDATTGRLMNVLQGHTRYITSVSFSFNGRILASKSYDGTVRLWRCDTWETVATLNAPASETWSASVAFHPTAPILATLDEEDTIIRVWDLDFDALLGAGPITSSIHYTNAKVVLVGESSSGKTCLARALMGEPFEPQPSTHGMKVWDFKSEVVKRADGGEISRETLLWDLAGQADYQVVHQLFLDETALGVVLFDASHPENPFGGIALWEKALRRVAGEECSKLLVAGRVDRGHPTVTAEDIEAFRHAHGFDEFIATSANTGEGVKALQEAIARAIRWERLPVTSSPELWKDIREYLLKRRAGDDVLTRRSDLREAFRQKYPEAKFADAEFDTVISHAQAQGLLWRLSFGDFVLLKPELLNDYASAVVRVARKHPKGLGSVKEREVLEAKIDFEDLKRLTDAETERSLLHAVVELFLNREVGLREGEYLVLPSKFNRKHPDFPKPSAREVAYRFAGPIEDIYATLAVRLFYCGAFELKDLWKNAAEFRDPSGRVCGFVLENPDEGHGLISIFFDGQTSVDSKVLFLRFIHEHLRQRALADSLERERVYRCTECGEEIGNRRAVESRLQKGLTTIPCQYCEDVQIKLIDLLEEKFVDPELLQRVRQLEAEAEEKKEQEVRITTVKAKEDIGEFDVFLAHNNKDKAQVEAVGAELKRRGLNPWLDKWNLPPGRRFAEEIERVLPQTKSVAVFVGESGRGPWHNMEIYAALNLFAENKRPLIPVLLPGATEDTSLPLFLHQFGWVRFEKGMDDTEALDNLQWGITGERPQKRLS